MIADNKRKAFDFNTGTADKLLLVIPLVLSLYVIASYFNYSTELNRFPTFPLDDAWIFWGFADTFADQGVLSLNSRTLAGAGVTSPGYMLILSLFIKLGFNDEFIVNLILNATLLFLSSVLIYRITDHIVKDRLIALFFAGLFILDARTGSIANSGMETLLFIFIQLLIFFLLQKEKLPLVFLFTGLGFWIRPEILAIVPAVLLLYRKHLRIKDFVYLGLPLLAYTAFLKVFTGNFWLNTGAAKNDFYSYISRWDYLKASFLYLGKTAFPFLPLLVLLVLLLKLPKIKFFRNTLPGNMSSEDLRVLAAIVFYFFSFWFAFLLYLPVLYHFGRYLFPLVPLLFLVSAYIIKWMTAEKKENSGLKRFPGRFRWIAYTVLFVTLGIAVFNFVDGKKYYAYECRSFLQRHIKLSYWIKENLPGDVSIATHDIGAIGYFTGKRVIDIIGLMDKEAVGISRDPQRIRTFLDKRKCDYIAVINKWFVVTGSKLLFETPVKGDIRFQIFKYGKDTQVIRYDLYHEKKRN